MKGKLVQPIDFAFDRYLIKLIAIGKTMNSNASPLLKSLALLRVSLELFFSAPI